MSLLSIAKQIAVNAGVAVPTAVLSNTSADALKIVQFTQEAGEEIARRNDWTALRKTATITGTGTNDLTLIAPDFARLIAGNSITSGGAPVRAGMTADEWNALIPIQGAPRYARIVARQIGLYPYLAIGSTVVVTYQSNGWCSSGTAWVADGDAGLVPEDLIAKGALWRWRRQLGQDYQDHLSEFEAAFAEFAKADEGIRIP